MSQKAVAYIRVSTKGQDDSGTSPEMQEDRCKKYAQEKGLKMARIFREARSGWKSEARIEFYRMFEFLEENKDVEHLIYAFADRFTRNMDELPKLREAAKGKKALHIHNLETRTSFNINDPNDYDAWCNEMNAYVEAERFSSRLSVRVKAGMKAKAKDGIYPGVVPIGYNAVILGKHKRRIEPDPERAPLIEKLFQYFAAGEYTLARIAEKMRNLGLRSRNGSPFMKSYIHHMLRNPFYYGAFKWKEEIYDSKGGYKPIITRELFDDVQRVLENRNVPKSRGFNFKYKGLLKCGLCGCSVVGETKTKTFKKTGMKLYTYYHCTGGRGKCSLPWFTESAIDHYFDMAMECLYIDPEIFDWLKNELETDFNRRKETAQAEANNLKKESADIEAKMSRLYGDWIKGSIPETFFRKEFQALETRQAEISELQKDQQEADNARLVSTVDTLVLMKDFKIRYLEAPPEKRMLFNKLMFSTIFVKYNPPRPTRLATDEDDFIPGLYPLDFHWNEPFKSLAEIQLEIDDSEFNVDEMPRFELRVPKKRPQKNIKRA